MGNPSGSESRLSRGSAAKPTSSGSGNGGRSQVGDALANIDWRLFAALLLMGLCPTIYTTLRTFFLGQLPGEYAYSIAGQLSWVSLLYEILDEAIILPLFFALGSPRRRPDEFSNRVRTGLVASCGIYAVFAAAIMVAAPSLLGLMAADPSIMSESASYIRIESVANVFGIAYRFLCVALVATGRSRDVYAITAAKLVMSVVLDTFLVSSLPVSLNLGVNGIGYSNIVSNAVLACVAWGLLSGQGYVRRGTRMSFSWIRKVSGICGLSGLESLVRNVAYLLMVSRMVNMVGEQGTYWVANNFIWGWMLLPVLQLGELIKKEVSADGRNVRRNLPGYMVATAAIVAIWVVAIPAYEPFMAGVLGFDDVDKLFGLVMILFLPYVAFAFQNVFDSVFYGRGRTDYMLFESVVTNSVYYGTMFVAYLNGWWEPSLTGIALMFGIGNVFDAVVSGLAFRHFLRRHKTEGLPEAA